MEKICSVKNCVNTNPKRLVKGFCLMHYRRWKATGDPGPPDWERRIDYGQCSFVYKSGETCSDKAGPTGACRKHWNDINRPEKRRNRTLSQFNITQAEYDRMFQEQGGRCKTCGTAEPGSNYTNFAIDHDHSCCPGVSNSCGQCIRGLLCSRCNMVLGLVADNKTLLRSLINYL